MGVFTFIIIIVGLVTSGILMLALSPAVYDLAIDPTKWDNMAYPDFELTRDGMYAIWNGIAIIMILGAFVAGIVELQRARTAA